MLLTFMQNMKKSKSLFILEEEYNEKHPRQKLSK